MLIVARGADGHRRRAASSRPRCRSSPTPSTGRERARAIGIWAGVSGLGIAIGPLGGGLLRRALLVGLGVPRQRADLRRSPSSLGHFFVPTSRDPDDRPLDPLGAVLSIVGAGRPALRASSRRPTRAGRSPTVRHRASPSASVFLGVVRRGGRRTRRIRCSTSASSRTRGSRRRRRRSRSRSSRCSARRSCSPSTSSSCSATRRSRPGCMTAPVAVGIMVVRAAGAEARRAVRHQAGRGRSACSIVAVGAAAVRVGHDHVVGRRSARVVRLLFGVGMGLTIGAGHRVDHGLAAAGQGRRRLGGQRHHPPDRRRARRRGHRQRLRGALPPRRRFGVGRCRQSARAAVQDSIGAALDAARNLPASEQAAHPCGGRPRVSRLDAAGLRARGRS